MPTELRRQGRHRLNYCFSSPGVTHTLNRTFNAPSSLASTLWSRLLRSLRRSPKVSIRPITYIEGHAP